LLNERGVAFTARKTWPARSPTAVGVRRPLPKVGLTTSHGFMTPRGLGIFKVPIACISVTGPRRIRKLDLHARLPTHPPTNLVRVPGAGPHTGLPRHSDRGLRHFNGVQI
ncbi:hypothetical protein BHE74_00055780, partial [Ensete ventricosum]